MNPQRHNVSRKTERDGLKRLGKRSISSRAAMIAMLFVAIPAEGSTTIPSGSRVQADSKHAAPCLDEDEDMVWSPVKAGEDARKRGIRNTNATRRNSSRFSFNQEPSPRKWRVHSMRTVWNTLRAVGATAWGGSPSANAEKTTDWAISSEAPRTGERSTTIPSGSRVRADSKHMAPHSAGEDMVCSPRKRGEIERKRLGRNIQALAGQQQQLRSAVQPVDVHDSRELLRDELAGRGGLRPVVSRCVGDETSTLENCLENPVNLERHSVARKGEREGMRSVEEMRAISSRAAMIAMLFVVIPAEGSTTRAMSRRVQADSKHEGRPLDARYSLNCGESRRGRSEAGRSQHDGSSERRGPERASSHLIPGSKSVTARTRIKTQSPVLSEEKARFLGFLAGDGGVYKNKLTY